MALKKNTAVQRFQAGAPVRGANPFMTAKVRPDLLPCAQNGATTHGLPLSLQREPIRLASDKRAT